MKYLYFGHFHYTTLHNDVGYKVLYNIYIMLHNVYFYIFFTGQRIPRVSFTVNMLWIFAREMLSVILLKYIKEAMLLYYSGLKYSVNYFFLHFYVILFLCTDQLDPKFNRALKNQRRRSRLFANINLHLLVQSFTSVHQLSCW